MPTTVAPVFEGLKPLTSHVTRNLRDAGAIIVPRGDDGAANWVQRVGCRATTTPQWLWHEPLRSTADPVKPPEMGDVRARVLKLRIGTAEILAGKLGNEPWSI